MTGNREYRVIGYLCPVGNDLTQLVGTGRSKNQTNTHRHRVQRSMGVPASLAQLFK